MSDLREGSHSDVGDQRADPAGPDRRDQEPTAESFDELYRRTYAGMVRLAHAMVDTRELAEEVVQDAYAAIYPRWDRVDDPAAYLRRSVINGSRRIQRRRALVRRTIVPPPDLATTDAYDHLLDQVRRLPPRQQAVVVLRYHLGLTDAGIAEALGISIGSVKSSLSRAKARLRKENDHG